MRYLERSRIATDQKIEDAYESLRETSLLISELEKGVRVNAEKLTSLQEQYRKYSELAKIQEEEASAVVRQLGELGRRERLIGMFINIAIGIIIFLLGIVLGPLIKGWLGISE